MSMDPISIHAPVKGATYTRALICRFQKYFNPRPREGSDKNAKVNPFVWTDFNPRPREGSDL